MYHWPMGWVRLGRLDAVWVEECGGLEGGLMVDVVLYVHVKDCRQSGPASHSW